MLKLVRWLLGYVCIRFSDGFTEDFINCCYQKQYNLSCVRRCGDALEARCPAGLVPLLENAARACGGKVTVLKECGPAVYFRKVSRRSGIFVGLLAGLLLLSFLTGFIWHIDVAGNERLSDAEILAFLADNGFHEGVWDRAVDYDRLANLLLASYEDIAWAHINRDGTAARVEIGESVLPPAKAYQKKPCHLKAAKDGVLVQATVYRGWAVRKKGDAVVRGDTLIAGKYKTEKGGTLYTHAAGEYIALVKEPLLLNVSRRQTEKRYIGQRTFRALYVFGLRVPLYLGGSNDANSDTAETAAYLRLGGRPLPLGLMTKTVREYTLQTKELSDSELTALTKHEIDRCLKQQFADAAIVKKNIRITLHADGAEARGTVLCRENIGTEAPIKTKKPKK